MELFAIHCTTCKARLIVKDESVIGDILACPKCQSMVQVVPPPGWRSGEPENAADDSPTESADAVRDGAVPSGAVHTTGTRASTAHPSDSATAATEDSSDRDSAVETVGAAAVPPTLPPRRSADDVAAEGADAAASETVSAAWSAENAASPGIVAKLVASAKRDWVMWSSGLGAGIALGTTMWLVVWWRSAETVPVAAVPTAAIDVDNAPDVPSASEPNEPSENAQAEPEPTPQVAAKSTANETSGTDSDAAADAAEATAPEPAAASEPAGEPKRKPAAKPQADSSPAEPNSSKDPAPAKAAEKSPALKLDPVAQGILSLETPAGPAPQATASNEPSADIPPTNEPAADTVPGADNATPPSAADIEGRLRVPLARVDFTEIPLGHFAAFVGDVSGVRVVLDEASLKAAGKNRRTPISVQLSGTTGADALSAALQGAGLDFKIESGRIVILAAPR